MLPSSSHEPLLPVEYLDTRQAELFSRRSYSTLRRQHRIPDRDTGLRKQGRRVVFILAKLREFLASEVGVNQ